MNDADLKYQMMKLWKDTFHDSDDYISLIFENYFDSSLVEYVQEDGKLISAMMAVPYDFIYKKYDNLESFDDKKILSNINCELRGLYLCGLATREEFRGKGIMKDLLERMAVKAQKLNFDFCFLIPADEHLRQYYEKLGYEKLFSRYEFLLNEKTINDIQNNLYSEMECDFSLKKNYDSKNVILDSLYSARIDVEEYKFEEIFEYFNKKEKEERGLSIVHSKKDFEIICREIYISGGDIIVARNGSKLICGLAFVNFNADDCVTVIKNIYCDNLAVELEVIRHILTNPMTEELRVVESVSGSKLKVLFQNREGNMLKPYGMLRITQPLEVLKFENTCSIGQKKSNFVNSGKLGDMGIKNELESDFIVASEDGRMSELQNKNLQNENCKTIAENGAEVLPYSEFRYANISLMLD